MNWPFASRLPVCADDLQRKEQHAQEQREAAQAELYHANAHLRYRLRELLVRLNEDNRNEPA